MLGMKCWTKKNQLKKIEKELPMSSEQKRGEGILETERTVRKRTSPEVIREPLCCSFTEFQEGNKQNFFQTSWTINFWKIQWGCFSVDH